MPPRIFSVRLNLDVLFASLGQCDTDADRSAWLRGFQIGSLGGDSGEGWDANKRNGWEVGRRAHTDAVAFQVTQAAHGARSAAARIAKNGTAIPVNGSNHPPNDPPNDPKGSSEPPSEGCPNQSSNRVIEESRDPVIEEPINQKDIAVPPARPRTKRVKTPLQVLFDKHGWRFKGKHAHIKAALQAAIDQIGVDPVGAKCESVTDCWASDIPRRLDLPMTADRPLRFEDCPYAHNSPDWFNWCVTNGFVTP